MQFLLRMNRLYSYFANLALVFDAAKLCKETATYFRQCSAFGADGSAILIPWRVNLREISPNSHRLVGLVKISCYTLMCYPPFPLPIFIDGNKFALHHDSVQQG